MYQTPFQKIELTRGRYLAHDIELFLGGPWLKLNIDVLESLSPAGLQVLTVLQAAKKLGFRVGRGFIPGANAM
jgi:hypothetical protein